MYKHQYPLDCGRLLFTVLLPALFPLLLDAQMATWEFDGPSLNVTYVEAGLQGAAATAGSGIASPGLTTFCTGAAWQGAGFSKNNRMSANNDYVEFRLTAPANYQLTVRTVLFTVASAGSSPLGPNQASVWVNNTWLAMAGSSTFTLTRDGACRNYGVIADAPVTVPANTTTIIRIYAWGGDATGLLRLDNVFIYGSFSPVLPIELISFTGKATDTGVDLAWTTASELNNDYMAVERSADGITFDEIGRVAGQGTTYQAQSYSFLDAFPLPGINYYRLRQVDFDGTMAYHPVISVMFKGESRQDIRFYPNPVDEALHVLWNSPSFEEPEEAVTLRILDPSGRIVARHILPGKPGEAVAVAHLPPGMYFLQLTQGRRQAIQAFTKQ